MTTINPANTVPKDVQDQVTDAFGFVPTFLRTLPPAPTRMLWSQLQGFQMSEDTALDGKTKELIGLAVASQIPCHYCIEFHTEAARLNGATDQELQEAIYMAALTRLASTVLNGANVDTETFDKDLKKIVKHLQEQVAVAR